MNMMAGIKRTGRSGVFARKEQQLDRSASIAMLDENVEPDEIVLEFTGLKPVANLEVPKMDQSIDISHVNLQNEHDGS